MATETFLTYFQTREAGSLTLGATDAILLLQGGKVTSVPLISMLGVTPTLVDASGGPITVTLPEKGIVGYIKDDSSANVVSFNVSVAGQTINAQVTMTNQFDFVYFQFLGTSWYVIGTNIKGISGDLNGMIADIGSVKTDLTISGACTLSGNLTIPENVSLTVLKTGAINQGSYTLTINGAFSAKLHQVFTGTGAVTFAKYYVKEITPIWFGAKGDGTTDDTTAIQLAISSVMPVASASIDGTSTPLDSPVITLPNGECGVSGKVNLYSGQILRGAGKKSAFKALAGFTGDRIINLYPSTNASTWQHGEVSGIKFIAASASGIAAIKPNIPLGTDIGTIVQNSTFKDIVLNCPFGIIATTTGYFQENLIQNIYSFGPLDQMLELRGNANQVYKLDKELGTGATTDPYVLVTNHNLSGSPAQSADNVFRDILIEGTGSTNKALIKLDGTRRTILENIWIETTTDNGYMFDINDSYHLRIQNNFRVPLYNTKIKLRKSHDVVVDRFSDYFDTSSSAPYNWYGRRIDIDTISDIRLGVVSTPAASNIYPVVANVKIDRIMSTDLASALDASTAAATGYVAEQAADLISNHNLFVNGGWYAGRYGWTLSHAGTTEEYIASTLGLGMMAHFNWASPAATESIYQNVTIPASMVGHKVTVSVPVKLTGVGKVVIVASNIGLGNSGFPSNFWANNYPAAYYEDWQILRLTFIPQSAGTASIGLYMQNFTNTTNVYLGEFVLSTNAVPSENRLTMQINNGIPTVYTTAAPSTGTWPKGSHAINTNSTVGQPKGWFCTVAGSPGTWVSEGNL